MIKNVPDYNKTKPSNRVLPTPTSITSDRTPGYRFTDYPTSQTYSFLDYPILPSHHLLDYTPVRELDRYLPINQYYRDNYITIDPGYGDNYSLLEGRSSR